MRLSFAFLVDSVVAVMTRGLGRIDTGALWLEATLGRVTAAAFGVFAGLHVTDFYVFLGCHNISAAFLG